MDKNNVNNNQDKKREHSFYKEANKSFLKNSEWTPKRVGSLVMKVTKWFVFGFLIVATLWGCVNEFIVQTSHNLGQGIEFYEQKDFVYPNMYQGVNISGYTAATKDITSDEQFVDNTDDKVKSQPFNFLTTNPYFKATQADYSTWQLTDAQKKAGETFDTLFKPETLLVDASKLPSLKTVKDSKTKNHQEIYFSNSLYAYNPNILTFSSEISYNGNDIEGANTSTTGLYLSASTLPSYISKQTVSVDGKDVYLNTWSKFAYNTFTNSNLNYGDGTTVTNDFFTFSTKDETEYSLSTVTGMKGTIAPTNINDETQPWVAIRSLDTNTLVGQVESLINTYAFNSGYAKSSYADVKDLTVKFNDEEMKFSEAISKANDSLEKTEDITVLDSYKIDYTKAGENIISSGGKIYGGAQTLIIPIAKGFPLSPTQEAQNKISAFRTNDETYASQIWGKYVDGFDPTVQNYGWTVLDQNGNLISLFDDQATAAQNIDQGNSEKNYLYATQRANGYGAINDWTNNKDLFDNKVKSAMGNQFVNMNMSLGKESFFNNTLSFDYGSKFAGVIGKDQVINTDSSFVGTLPTYTSNSMDVTQGKFEQNSMLAKAVAPVGQDGTNYHRVIFQGWGDWGKAWNPQYGPLYGAFVFPLAQISMGIGDVFNYHGNPWGTLISIFVIVFILRGIGALMSIKGTNNQMKMQEIQTEVAKIKSKYNNYDLKANKQMKQKQQLEIMALYRKNNINPMGSIGTIFITMPIFLSLWIIISALPAYKAAYMGQFAFSVSSFYGMFNLGSMFFLYLLVGLTVGLVQGVSSKLPTWLGNKRKGIKRLDEATKKAMKKQNKTQNIMVGVFIVMGLTVPVLLAFYWITSGLFTISLEIFRHIFKVRKAKKIKGSN